MGRTVLTKLPVEHDGKPVPVGTELSLTDEQAQALVDAEAADFVAASAGVPLAKKPAKAAKAD